MAKLIDEIVGKMSDAAAKEFKAAIEGMTLLDNAKGDYVSKAKAEAELTAEKKLNTDLSTSVEALKAEVAKGGEASKAIDGLQAKLKDAQEAHQKELGEMKSKAESDKKTEGVKAALRKAGAHDPDIALLAMGLDLNKLDHDDKGNLVGLSDRIKALQGDKTYLFNVNDTKGTHKATNAPDTGVAAMADAAMASLNYKK